MDQGRAVLSDKVHQILDGLLGIMIMMMVLIPRVSQWVLRCLGLYVLARTIWNLTPVILGIAIAAVYALPRSM